MPLKALRFPRRDRIACMAELLPSESKARIGRRGRSRVRVYLPARIIAVDGTQTGTLLDISLTGVQLKLTRALRNRAEVLVQFDRYELFGTVVWTDSDRCGVDIDEGVPSAVVLAARARHDEMMRAGGWSPEREAARRWVNGTH